MKAKALSRTFRIKDRRTAAVFSNPLRRRIVLLCADQARSVSEMAEILPAST